MILFSKIHVNGNDFMVLDNRNCSIALPTSATVSQWSDRRRGVGFDQLLWISLPSKPHSADLTCRIFNASGSLAQQCGHGMACLFEWWQRHVGETPLLKIETPVGICHVTKTEDNKVCVHLGPATFLEQITTMPHLPRVSALPLLPPFEALHCRQLLKDQQLLFNAKTLSNDLQVGLVSLGNPHCIVWVKDFDSIPTELGEYISQHPQFLDGINVEFMQVLNRRQLRLKVYERGVGETLACGTGACAALVIAQRWGLVDTKAEVQFIEGDRVNVRWLPAQNSVSLITKVQTVFQGRLG